MYLPAMTHIAPLLTIRRERALPTPGQILVRPGDQVGATDVIARSPRNTKHSILDIARLLRIESVVADAKLEVEPGSPVEEGQTLAENRSLLLFRRRVRSPFDGEVIAVGDGRVLLASRDEPFELRAFMPGTVLEIQPSLSVLIETNGALIQSKWGSGRKTFGILRVAATDPNQPLLAQSIDVGYQDAIIVVGGMVGREALQAVIAARARGIVAGSIPGELADYARRVHFPILITEGFGNRVMPNYTWALLVENNGRDAVLDANPTDRFAGSRPELIIPLPPIDPQPPFPVEGEPLITGKRVRMIRAPHVGETGIVSGVPTERERFPSGLIAFPVVIELENGETISTPRKNVEIIEQSTLES